MKQHLAMLAIQNQDSVTQEITVWRKRRQKQYQDRQPYLEALLVSWASVSTCVFLSINWQKSDWY